MMPKPVHRELSWQRHRAAGSRGVSGSSKNGNRGAQAIEEVRATGLHTTAQSPALKH
jgi:hypothetical protein